MRKHILAFLDWLPVASRRPSPYFAALVRQAYAEPGRIEGFREARRKRSGPFAWYKPGWLVTEWLLRHPEFAIRVWRTKIIVAYLVSNAILLSVYVILAMPLLAIGFLIGRLTA